MSPTQSKFSPADHAQWRALVDKVLKGAPVERLSRHDEDGLEIRPFYDVLPYARAAEHAGAALRLPRDPQQHLAHGWDVCQPVDGRLDAPRVNRLILDELEDGASSLWLGGLPQTDQSTLERIMQGVVLPAAGVVLDSGNAALSHVKAFAALARQHGTTLAQMRFAARVDPFLPDADPLCLDAAFGYLEGAAPEDVPAGLFAPDGWRWHNRGMTAVQELAYILAGLTAVLRRAHATGLDVAALVPRLSATLALPADVFDGITKTRALRQCWGGIMTALGLDPAQHRLTIHGATSLRMFSTLDIEVNMLRVTTALLGGAIGGADRMSAFAHDCLGGASADGRRLARMQQHMMIEESGLSRSLDPAGGAGFIEARTQDLAMATWAAFQKIEVAGGAVAARETGLFASQARQSAAARFARLAKGALQLVGVNLQPDGRQFPAVLPHWRDLRRPAAAIEAIRQLATDSPPRILVLQADDGSASTLADLRRTLAMGRMTPVLMRLADTTAATLAAARPDHVLLLDCDFDAFDDDIKRALGPLAARGGVHLGAAVLADPSPLHRLAAFAGMSLGAFEEGDA
jgi:methylmalonyl-CoA mutase